MSALKIFAIPTALLVGTFPLWANEANHHHHQAKTNQEALRLFKHYGIEPGGVITIKPVPKTHSITPMLRTKTQAR